MRILSQISAAAWIALLVVMNPVHATTINGEISISGGFVPVGGTSLADATYIDFLEWDGSAYVSGTSSGTFGVNSVAGDFASYITASPFTLGTINDFSFVDTFTPVTPLWEIGGFSFDLSTVTIEKQNSTTLILSGSGSIYGNGFEVTEGSWNLTANTIFGSTFSWSATTGVPEATSLSLLAMSLLGLALVARRKRLS